MLFLLQLARHLYIRSIRRGATKHRLPCRSESRVDIRHVAVEYANFVCCAVTPDVVPTGRIVQLEWRLLILGCHPVAVVDQERRDIQPGYSWIACRLVTGGSPCKRLKVSDEGDEVWSDTCRVCCNLGTSTSVSQQPTTVADTTYLVIREPILNPLVDTAPLAVPALADRSLRCPYLAWSCILPALSIP